MRRSRVLVVSALLAMSMVGAGIRLAQGGRASAAHDRMAKAAAALLESLPAELRGKAALAFDDKARLDWHFVPRSRPGVRMADMNDAQKTAARDLLRSALSSQGVLKVEQIMSLDLVLRELENNPARDPLQYTFTVYGEPGAEHAWGWKIEGHHISLNFTCVKGQVVSAMPSFLGANPGRVLSGPRAGERVLAVEEDLGRAIVQSFDESQRAEGIIAKEAPADILTIPGRSLDDAKSVGVSYATMNAEQRAMLDELIEEYAHTLRRDLAHGELERIRAAGIDGVRFAWAGSTEPGKGHYYRITGPTFVIEYDNTQNNANHPHTVWHDRARDFGHDALREHYQHDHQK